MAAVKDVVAYLCSRYPDGEELSKARLTKMVYLADWKSALESGHQMTDIAWEFNHYGPYVDDVVLSVRDVPGLQLVAQREDGKQAIRRDNVAQGWPSLSEQDRHVLDHVIRVTAPKYWDEFIKLIYSTYPVLASPRYTHLDLVDLAARYRSERGG